MLTIRAAFATLVFMTQKSQPDVSVVIPTKNRLPLLRRALASAASQSVEAVEIVVVDDGDGSGAAEARQRVSRPLVTVDNGGAGQVAARNRGVAAASGRLIAFLDDDDWWEGDKHLAAMTAAMSKAGLVYACGQIVPEGPGAAGMRPLPFEAKADAESIRHDNLLLVSGIVYERALHQRLGDFDGAFPYYWDWDWYLRLFAAGVPVSPARSDAVRISARHETVSAPANEEERRANLARLCAKHGLTGIVLRNHESIARDQNRSPVEQGA
jgi:glycosyltransferase involved in cell wall biosynthesis